MKQFLSALLFLAVSALFADGWEIKNLPAHLDHPGEIRLIPGEVQALAFYFVTPQSVLSAKDSNTVTPGGDIAVSKPRTILGERDHKMSVEITLPPGAEFITSVAGDQAVEVQNGHTVTVRDNVVTDCYICDKAMLQPQGRMSEWKTYKIALRLPAVAEGKETLKLKVYHNGNFAVEKEWTLKRCAAPVPASELKKIKLGLWDAGTYMLEKAHPGLVKFWQKAGFNCAWGLFKGIDVKKFELYATLHHSKFSEPGNFPGFAANGSREGGEVNGWYLRKYPLWQILPEIGNDMKNHGDLHGSGWIGMDYEPTGLSGFIPGSVADFKKEYQVSDAEYESLRQLMVKKGFGCVSGATPAQLETYKKWNAYQSSLQENFVRELRNALAKAAPGMKFHNTTLDALPPPDVKGTGLGIDASIQAKHLDMIEPQLYVGYDEVGAKYEILRTRAWKKRVSALNPNCILHPFLLVRYAGGKNRNSASRLRQQTIGTLAEGAQGVSYYFLECFDGEDWAKLADMTRQIAAVEDFYADGKRCDERFEITGVPHRIAYQIQWPHGKCEVPDPDWHMTAHELNGKVLVTFFNLDEKKPCTFGIKTQAAFESIRNGKQNSDGTFTAAPGEIAYLIFQ